MKFYTRASLFTLLLAAAAALGSDLKYVEHNQLGEPSEVLEVKDDPSRPLNSGEVRVEVLATPIHPSDLLRISGSYGVSPALPSTPGSEGVGRVTEISEEVTHLAEGQLVLLAGGSTWRDELIAPAAQLVPLPDLGTPGMEVIEQLSMSAVNPMTALLLLENFVDLEEGDWVVQSAANSAVGEYVVQLAKQRGINSINVVRREGLAEDLMAKGATVVLIDGPDLASRIAQATGDADVSLAIDAVGGETFTRLAQSLGFGGTVVAYSALSRQPASLNMEMAIYNDLRVRTFWLLKWFETADAASRQQAMGQVISLIAEGKLKADVDSRYALEDIKQAVSRAAEGGRNGKVLLVPAH